MPVGRIGISVLLVGTVMSGCSSGGTRAESPRGEWQRVDTTQTLSFVEARRISGDAGCNRFSGALEIDANNTMRIGPVMSTKRACADAGKMRQETEYLRSLGQVTGFRFPAPDRLILVDEAGQPVLTFQPVGSTR